METLDNEGGTLVLIASVPGHCSSISFNISLDEKF